jgi:hypothetical protein
MLLVIELVTHFSNGREARYLHERTYYCLTASAYSVGIRADSRYHVC